MTLLERINMLREKRGNVSINKLEKEAGLTRGSMSKWDNHAPSYDKLKKVADYFGVSVAYLLGEATTQDGIVFSDGTGYGGGFGSGAGFGDGTGYGGSLPGENKKNKPTTIEGDELTETQKEVMKLVSEMSEEQLKQFIRIAKAVMGEE